MPIVEVKWGLNQPAYITSWGQWDVCFYPFRKRRSAKHGSYLKSNKPQQKQNNVAPIFLTLPTWQNEILASSLQHTNTAMLLLFLLAHAANSLHLTISWAASFRLIWIFMNVVRWPHSIIGEIAWHGAPNPFTLLTSVWEPCTSSNCGLYFTESGCHQRCRCYGEKWEAKNSMGEGGGKHSSLKNLYWRKMNGVFKVTKPKLNRLIPWGGNTCWQGAPSLREVWLKLPEQR